MVTQDILDKYEMTIGIECHVQLATTSKLFSGADNDARGKAPNEATSPIDFGLPGMLPVLNYEAIRLAVRAGKALNADIAHVSRFDRKHYFYPDLPKGYQITQMYQPIIIGGLVEAPMLDGSTVKVRIHHAHIEEDAGKLTHHAGFSLVDLNRAGTPLIEIVSEPDIHSAAGAKAYATELQRLMTFAGVSLGDLYQGNMRFDVNLSVALKGATELGTRAEVKNLNSFRSVEKAAEYEYLRQIEILEKGEAVVQETRGWDDASGRTSSQRSKEDAQDYRYMPDADIPPVVLTAEEIAEIQSHVPKLPADWRDILRSIGVKEQQIETLIDGEVEFNLRGISFLPLIEQEKENAEKAKSLVNWYVNVSIPILKEESHVLSNEGVMIADKNVHELFMDGKMTSINAKTLYRGLLALETLPESIESFAQEQGYIQNNDESAIEAIVDEVLSDPASAQSVADIKDGQDKAIGFLVGQVMKKSAGKANPGLAQQLIRKKIKG